MAFWLQDRIDLSNYFPDPFDTLHSINGERLFLNKSDDYFDFAFYSTLPLLDGANQ